MGALCFVCINRTAPGEIHHLDHGSISIGEFGRPASARVRAIAGDWQRAIAAARAAMAGGVDPASPSLAPLAETWEALIREFSGGDREIETATAKMYRAEPDLGPRYGMDRALDVWVGAMLRAHGKKVGDVV